MKINKRLGTTFLLSSLACAVSAQVYAEDMTATFDQNAQFIVRAGIAYAGAGKNKDKATMSYSNSHGTNVQNNVGNVYGKDRKLDTSSNVLPSVSLTYMLNEMFGIEGMFAFGNQSFSLKKTDTVREIKFGNIRTMYGSLMAQFYQNLSDNAQAYFGLGGAYTKRGKSKEKSMDITYNAGSGNTNKAATLKTRLSAPNTFAPAVQAGIDFYPDSNWLLNLSAMYMFNGKQKVKFDQYGTGINGAETKDKAMKGTVKSKLSSWFLRASVGYRF